MSARAERTRSARRESRKWVRGKLQGAEPVLPERKTQWSLLEERRISCQAGIRIGTEYRFQRLERGERGCGRVSGGRVYRARSGARSRR